MPVITFATFKGGAGKTTSCIVIGTELCRHTTVTIIDADPARRLCNRWATKAPLPDNLTVIECCDEGSILDVLEEARKRSTFVLVDTEGVASRLNTMISLNSNLVIIPLGDEQQDADDAVDTLKVLRDDGRTVGRTVPAKLLFCRTKAAVKSKLEKGINAEMRAHIPAFKTELKNRTAYSSLHNTGGTLQGLEEAGRLEKAFENADDLLNEIAAHFQENAQ